MRDGNMNKGGKALTMEQDAVVAEAKGNTNTQIVASNGFVVEIMTPE